MPRDQVEQVRAAIDLWHRLHLPANPSAGRWRLGGNVEESADPFTAAELRAILAHAEEVGGERFATMVQLWAQTGMRLGEVSALQYQDLDLKASTAIVRRTWSKGRLGPPKTRRTRVVNLCHPIVDDPQQILRRLQSIGAIAPDLFLFGGERPWPNQFVTMWCPWCGERITIGLVTPGGIVCHVVCWRRRAEMLRGAERQG